MNPNLPASSQSHDSNALSSTKHVLSQLSALQTQLFEAVAELQQILDLQDSRLKLTREIKSKDAAMLEFSKRLKDAEQVLDSLVDDYAEFRGAKRTKSHQDDDDDDEDEESSSASNVGVASKLELKEVLSYAHKISYTTFAPPDFGAGNAPLRGALPPAPQDEQMRPSQLYHFANPKTVESEEKAFDAMIEAPIPPPPQATEYNQPPFQGILPPPGWKPGMPVELPMDIPAPPPGWKPGDPVPLDAFPMHVPPPQVRANAAQGMQKVPATIQVQHVQLDILDQDDDSSDYSSDEGSSEDDD